MTQRTKPARTSSHIAAPESASSSTIRPRNRRLITIDDDSGNDAVQDSSGLLAPFNSDHQSRSSRSVSAGGNRTGGPSPNRAATLGQFFNDSWSSSLASLQGLTTSFIAGQGLGSIGSAKSILQQASDRTVTSRSWGPAPPVETSPSVDDVAAGSLVKRQAALRAAKTASVLESHEGVNGGLDITGKHKRRNSDDASASAHQQPEDYMVYVHKVQSKDTFVGIVLRYKCGEDALRKANGLWSRDSVLTRKWLTIPIDACEIRGRPCDAPLGGMSDRQDLLAPTPSGDDERKGRSEGDYGFFASSNGEANALEKPAEGERPWMHVKWVKIDSFPEPVEIGRVARTAMGYFPPRRRKSLRTISSQSTPKQSIDLSGGTPGSVDDAATERLSSSSRHSQLPGTPPSSRSRGGSGGHEARPAWMRRPGGVGSMGRNIRAPGPDNDYLNTWTKKHLPGLTIEGLPSMSIMGSEQARWGFAKDAPNIAESPYEEGRDVESLHRQGTGLDKAAATVETWLRGALARKPSTPLLRGKRVGTRALGDGDGDLIELADTNSDDGKFMLDQSPKNLPQSLPLGTSSRSNGEGSTALRGRMVTSGLRDKKSA